MLSARHAIPGVSVFVKEVEAVGALAGAEAARLLLLPTRGKHSRSLLFLGLVYCVLDLRFRRLFVEKYEGVHHH